jgi:RNA polymerase sigma-70 factor (ECF subfamily)
MTFPLWFDRIFLDTDQRDIAPDRRPRLVRSQGSTPHEDQTLLAELASSDLNVAAGALEGIFRDWYAKLIAFARVVTGDEANAQDVVQDIFIDLWRRRTSIVLTRSLAAYLHSAVRHRALTRRRDEANRNRLLGTIGEAEYVGTVSGERPSASERDSARDDDRRFHAVISAADTLPPRAREVFYLRWRQSLSYKEIAVVMGISVKTVEAQMTIAMRRVREELTAL